MIPFGDNLGKFLCHFSSDLNFTIVIPLSKPILPSGHVMKVWQIFFFWHFFENNLSIYLTLFIDKKQMIPKTKQNRNNTSMQHENFITAVVTGALLTRFTNVAKQLQATKDIINYQYITTTTINNYIYSKNIIINNNNHIHNNIQYWILSLSTISLSARIYY